MISAWLRYLAAATVCQAVLALFYALALARLSAFRLNRAYLLGALLVSVGLPLVALPSAWAQWLGPVVPAGAGTLPWVLPLPAAPRAGLPAAGSAAAGLAWQGLLLGTYWLGVAWQVGRTLRGLGWLLRLRRHPRTRLGAGWLVHLPTLGTPAFCFGHYVFLSPAHEQLSPAEYAQLLAHEQVHGQQHHALDLLLAEVLGWFFWFNGLVAYLRRQLRTVHEYLADAAVAPAPGGRAAYGRLLLKLAAPPLPASLAHPFAARQVARRIRMLTSPPPSPMQKLRFLLVAPVAALAWLGAAALGSTPSAAQPTRPAPTGKTQSRIGTISWQGNTYLSTAQLNEALGLKPGDPYNKEALAARLGYNPDGRDVTSRYMDNGYLFFQITPVAKTRPDGTTDLTFVLSEGRQVRIGTITVTGNYKVPTAEVLALLPLRGGELFSRAKLIESQRALAASGRFRSDDPATAGYEGIQLNPQPVPQPTQATDLVNIALVVTEK